MSENNSSNVFLKFYNFIFSRFIKRKESFEQSINELIEEHKETQGDKENVGIEVLQNILSYGELRASDVMIPRCEIAGVDQSVDLKSLKTFIKEKRHTRFPVFNNSLDDVKGFVNIKDIFPMISGDIPLKLDNLLREILVIPPSIKIIKLLSEMRKKKTHIAIVVDEFGGTDGLITIENIIEEIVGEIEDEHDSDSSNNATLINKTTMIVSARYCIEEFEKKFDTKIRNINKEDDFDTIGGAIMSFTGYVPERGEKIQHSCGIEFEIIDSNPRKINKVIARKKI